MDNLTLPTFMQDIIEYFTLRFNNLTGPSALRQFAIIAVVVGLAWLLSRFYLKSKRSNWIKMPAANVPKRRVQHFIRKNLWLMISLVLLGVIYLIMRQITITPRSYFIRLAWVISLAWFIIGVASTFISHRVYRKTFNGAAMVFAASYYLGVLDDIGRGLKAVSLPFGSEGFNLLTLLQAVGMLILLVTIARFVRTLIMRRVEGNPQITPSLQVLISKSLSLLLYGTAIMYGFQKIGFDLTSLAVLSGAIGLGIGFGLQKVVSNLISGIILLLDKSIKPGDVISLGDTFGWISSLGARYVSVVTRAGHEHLIPNEDLITSQVVNWTHSSELIRVDVHFGVDYNSDPHFVRKIAIEAASSVKRVVQNNAPVCHIVNFGDSSIDFVLRFWIVDPSKGLTNVRGDVFLALWDRLKAENINIPFPRRDVHVFKNDSPELTD